MTNKIEELKEEIKKRLDKLSPELEKAMEKVDNEEEFEKIVYEKVMREGIQFAIEKVTPEIQKKAYTQAKQEFKGYVKLGEVMKILDKVEINTNKLEGYTEDEIDIIKDVLFYIKKKLEELK